MIGVAIGVGRRRRVSGGNAAPGSARSIFAPAPTAHYHPASQNAVLDGQSRVLSCPDIRGLAPLSGLSFAGATIGPREMTDGLGRRFWRFENAPGASSGDMHLLVANTLAGLSARAVTVMAVARHHRAASLNVFAPRYSAYTSDGANTTYSGGATLRSVVTSSSAPILSGANVSAASARHITGAQLQLMGVASRATAGGGQRIYLNTEVANVAQSGVVFASCTGGVIGGIPGAGNTVAASTSFMDLYELAIWKGELTNAQADAAAAAMVANWSIPAVADSLLLEGDSITQGTGGVTSGLNIAMHLTAPAGASRVPPGWRVINQGLAGNTVASLAARRDAANSAAALPLPGGRNIVACQIGRNDLPTAAGPQIYAAIAALHNTAGVGFLQRGWEVMQAVNIASAPAFDAELQNLRAALRDIGQFRADTQSGAGQAFDGKLSIIDVPLWTVLGDTIFDTSADAGDTTWYAGDSTHPGPAGAVEMTKAYRAGLPPA
jgi:hypothetical protein